MRHARLSFAGILLTGLLLSACSSAPPPPSAATQTTALRLPALRLPPVALGHTLSLAQRLRVDQAPAAGEAYTQGRTLEAQLEVDPAELRLAGMALGQRVLTLSWNGEQLRETRHPLLPREVDAARVLRDVQWVYWPMASIAAALPPGWQVTENTQARSLSFEGRVQLQAHYESHDLAARWLGPVVLTNHLEGYRLTIESVLLGDTPNP